MSKSHAGVRSVSKGILSYQPDSRWMRKGLMHVYSWLVGRIFYVHTLTSKYTHTWNTCANMTTYDHSIETQKNWTSTFYCHKNASLLLVAISLMKTFLPVQCKKHLNLQCITEHVKECTQLCTAELSICVLAELIYGEGWWMFYFLAISQVFSLRTK
jgi:hypothetical protein